MIWNTWIGDTLTLNGSVSGSMSLVSMSFCPQIMTSDFRHGWWQWLRQEFLERLKWFPNPSKILIFMEHWRSDKGAHLETVFCGVGSDSFYLRFLFWLVFIQFFASLVAVELSPVTLHEKIW